MTAPVIATSLTSSASANSTALSLSNTLMSNDSFKLIAESIGITNLGEDACKELAMDLAFTLKSILIDAQKFARKSRRKVLVTADLDYALKSRSLEPVYGFYANDRIPFRSTTSVGGVGGGRSIYYTEEQVVDLNELVSTNNASIKLPNDFAINAHWLAIEGVQPLLAENPQLISREMQKKEAIEGATSKTKQHQLQQQQQQTQQQRGENYVKLKSLLPHDLSMEQQIYFKEVTEACVGADENKRTEALNSLSTDPGLHQLLPRFVLFVTEGVRLNIIQYNMAILIYLMRMARSLIENKAIYLEKYLHELLPAIMSCLLSKQLCARPDQDNHYALREFCAHLIGQIIKIYGSTLSNLQSRIIQVYLNSLQSDKTTFATLFGTCVGFAELGTDACRTFIFPLVKVLGERIAQILDSVSTTNQEKMPVDKCKQELVKIISNVLKEFPPNFANDEFDYLTSEFGAYFGQLIHTQLIKIRPTSNPAAKQPLNPLPHNNTLNRGSFPNGQHQNQHQSINIQYIAPKPLVNANQSSKQQQQQEQQQSVRPTTTITSSSFNAMSPPPPPIHHSSSISSMFKTSPPPTSPPVQASVSQHQTLISSSSSSIDQMMDPDPFSEEEDEESKSVAAPPNNNNANAYPMDENIIKNGNDLINSNSNSNNNNNNSEIPDHTDDWLFYS